ncbi:hypothetical protein BBI01_01245 [Chryseobacterium artocarpi]|uniref:Metallo-beta-lactamase domain-containing protein n=1 Tax=Chryseobacterium artocarpi TaxID=1414727 RepID=A0A1B8ZZV1_9FLAO|nr:MBL fold metallo-hydrolase [Chryseobacterium artocarpi]OCA77117.1 hypothetical protein BBI01_01245 [Chryseobacterium artocarpi]
MEHDLKNEHKTKVIVLPAHHGDSIIIKTFDSQKKPFNILIDGGTAKTYDEVLRKEVRKIPFIDIVILTHIDSDHIAGLIKLIKSEHFDPKSIGKYWFNSKNIKFISSGENISVAQAKTFEELLIDKGEVTNKWVNEVVVGTIPQLPDGVEIEIISPSSEILEELYKKWPSLSDEYNKKLEDLSISAVAPSQISRGSLPDLAKEDDTPEKKIMTDISNSSSIAFIFKTFDMSVLFLGDAHPHFIVETLKSKGYSKNNRLSVDYVKVSHHGSKNNTTNELLDLLDCDNYIISTNGGNSDHTHPDRETIARIIHHPYRVEKCYPNLRKIYLNHKEEKIRMKAGEFVNDEDRALGNWQMIENINVFENE